MSVIKQSAVMQRATFDHGNSDKRYKYKHRSAFEVFNECTAYKTMNRKSYNESTQLRWATPRQKLETLTQCHGATLL